MGQIMNHTSTKYWIVIRQPTRTSYANEVSQLYLLVASRRPAQPEINLCNLLNFWGRGLLIEEKNVIQWGKS